MDAACGPSNGVKSLQRHFDQDRSLHQSQIRPGYSNQQFREGPSADQVNRAAQAQQQFLHAGRGGQTAEPYAHIDEGQKNWANDFEHTSVRATIPYAQSSQARRAQQAPALGGWGAEFLAVHESQLQLNQQFLSPGAAFQGQPMLGQPGFASYTPAMQYGAHMTGTHLQSSEPQVSTNDQELFSQAFAEAEASLQRVNLLDAAATATRTTDEAHQPVEFSASRTQLEEMQRLAARETLDEMDERHESDALASKAGELIDAMRSEQSDKFQNSNFMRLMHQLRDKEVLVRQGKMVEAGTGNEVQSHIGGTTATVNEAVVYPPHELSHETL